ncbi:MAG: tetratricopeptide repeat protein [Gemmataceae bacterium]
MARFVLHPLKGLRGWLTGAWRLVCRRPRLALAAVVVTLTVAGASTAGYVNHQWRAAQAALDAGRAAEARPRLEVCLFFWPRDQETRLLAARAARLTGDFRTAERHLTRCLKLHGGATQDVQLEFLLLRVQTGEVDEVSSALIDVVEKGHPSAPLILETVSRAYIHRLRYKAAYACLTRWLQEQPDSAKAYQWRGWVLERLNHPRPAANDYLKALEIDPDLIPVRLRVAEMLLEDMRVPEALPHLERLYRQAPTHPGVQARLGVCRFLQNKTAEARKLLEAAVVGLPDDPSLLITLAKLDLQDGKGPEAEGRLRAVLKQDSADTEALFNLVSALQLQRRTEESAATMKVYKETKARLDRVNVLLKDVADSPTATAADYAEIGELLLRINRGQQAVYWLERALERDPAQQVAHKALAEYHEKKGETDKASAHRRWLTSGKG